MSAIAGFVFNTLLGKVASLAVLGIIVAGWFAIERRGAEKAIAKIERRDEKSITIADKAGTASRSAKSRGVLDPYVRND